MQCRYEQNLNNTETFVLYYCAKKGVPKVAFSLKKYNTFGLEVEATWGIEINDFVMFDMAFKKIKETR